MQTPTRILAAAVATGVFAVSANAATIITTSTLAPVVTGDDIANLVADTGGNLAWGDRGVSGQSFTMGSQDGFLTALTVLITEGDTEILGWKDWRLRIGTYDALPGTMTPILNEVVRHEDDENGPTYFTFVFDVPINLSANTSYVFDVGVQNSQNGWRDGIPSVRKSGNDYAGGASYGGKKTSEAATDYTLGGASNNDLIFHADIFAVPEPSSLALLGLGGLMMVRRRKG